MTMPLSSARGLQDTVNLSFAPHCPFRLFPVFACACHLEYSVDSNGHVGKTIDGTANAVLLEREFSC